MAVPGRPPLLGGRSRRHGPQAYHGATGRTAGLVPIRSLLKLQHQSAPAAPSPRHGRILEDTDSNGQGTAFPVSLKPRWFAALPRRVPCAIFSMLMAGTTGVND